MTTGATMMSPGKANKAQPQPLPVSAPYWEGTQNRELRFQRCQACRKSIWYPRRRCNHCGSADLAWEASAGRAKLVSYVINHLPAPGFKEEVPYVIALVKLDEGPQLMTNIVGVEPRPESLLLDMPLEVEFQTRGEHSVPVFRPILTEAS